MNSDDTIDAWLTASAALLKLTVEPEWRDGVRLHLRITWDMAERVMDFPLPDDTDPAPEFRA